MRKGEIPDIYVQDYKLFDEYKEELKKWFGEGIGYIPYVGIHLRVGSNPSNPMEPNYKDNPFYYPLAESDYYNSALELFPNKQFLVFSDDMNFAKNYFLGDEFFFDDSKTDIESFNKLASCDGKIIANSSFSWWTAYLSRNDGRIIAPKRWFADENKNVPCPDNWIMLE